MTSPPLDRHRKQWTEPVAYENTQALADAAREAGTQVLRYRSARADGANIALLTCAAFTSREPKTSQVWRLHTGPAGVRAICMFPEQRLAFESLADGSFVWLAPLRRER